MKTPLPEQAVEFIDQVIFHHYFKIFEEEDNKEVIEKTLECIREMCEVLGPAAIANKAD